jgi:hypothetical protein
MKSPRPWPGRPLAVQRRRDRVRDPARNRTRPPGENAASRRVVRPGPSSWRDHSGPPEQPAVKHQIIQRLPRPRRSGRESCSDRSSGIGRADGGHGRRSFRTERAGADNSARDRIFKDSSNPRSMEVSSRTRHGRTTIATGRHVNGRMSLRARRQSGVLVLPSERAVWSLAPDAADASSGASSRSIDVDRGIGFAAIEFVTFTSAASGAGSHPQ